MPVPDETAGGLLERHPWYRATDATIPVPASALAGLDSGAAEGDA